ncbi:MAG: class I SAM-dependent methyltransferase [Anaerolineae bacterium]
MEIDLDQAARYGLPSYRWGSGQERRMALIKRWAPLDGTRVLDVGCGLGLYLHRIQSAGATAVGVDLNQEHLREADLAHSARADAQVLPFSEGAFDVVILNEILEHVKDDGLAVAEAIRVMREGGRLLIFAPNRLYPFETHGVWWRGRYRFGNYFLVGYLPNAIRQRLAPHVRAYTRYGLRKLFDALPSRILVHERIFAGYDRIALRRPGLARLLRSLSYPLERTPLQIFGLSHFLVAEKQALPPQPESSSIPPGPSAA